MQLRGRTTWLAAALWLVVPAAANAQGFPPPPTAEVAAEVRSVLAAMKADERGPFQRIRWYCNDGTVHAPEGHALPGAGGAAHSTPSTPPPPTGSRDSTSTSGRFCRPLRTTSSPIRPGRATGFARWSSNGISSASTTAGS